MLQQRSTHQLDFAAFATDSAKGQKSLPVHRNRHLERENNSYLAYCVHLRLRNALGFHASLVGSFLTTRLVSSQRWVNEKQVFCICETAGFVKFSPPTPPLSSLRYRLPNLGTQVAP